MTEKQQDTKDKKKKSKISNSIKILLMIALFIFSILVVLPLGQTFGKGDTITLGKMFESMNWEFAIYAGICVVAVILIGGIRLTHITYSTSKKFMPFACLRIFLLGRFYDCVTPLATGGQPFEIYELNKKGIPGGISTAIPLIRYFIQMFTIAPCSLFLFLFFKGSLSALDPTLATVVSVSAYIGMGVFMIIPLFLIVVSIFPKIGMKIAFAVIKIGSKLKIIKDMDAMIAKAEKLVGEFKLAMKYAASNAFHVISITILSLLEFFIGYCVPFFLCVALGNVQPSYSLLIQTITLNAYAYFAVSFMPTPGNAGFSESMFAMVFAGVALGQNVIFWLVLVWRLLTYYIYIFLGLIILIIDFIRKRVSYAKIDKSSCLSDMPSDNQQNVLHS